MLAASSRSASVITIEGDRFWAFAVRDPRPFKPQFRTLTSSIAGAAVPFAKDGCEVIVDFVVPPWCLKAFTARAWTHDVDVHYVVVWPPVDTCARRAQERSVNPVAYDERVRTFYDRFGGECPSRHRMAIADVHRSAASIAAEIRSGIDSGAFLLPRDTS